MQSGVSKRKSLANIQDSKSVFRLLYGVALRKEKQGERINIYQVYRAFLCFERRIRRCAPERRSYEYPKSCGLQHNVCHTGSCHGSGTAADGAVLRDRQGRLYPHGKGCGGSRCGVLERTVPGYDRLLSAQCAPDAGFLADVRRYAGTAGRSASLELDAERGHHGGGTDRRGAPLVHPAGRCTESIQVRASANDHGFCVFGKCSRRKGRCVV